MLHQDVPLTRSAILDHPGNIDDNVSEQCQIHWIAETIAYCYPAIKELFEQECRQDLAPWPNMPVVDCLKTRKVARYALGPILENEGTLEGTYGVINNIFGKNTEEEGHEKGQLGYGPDIFDDGWLVLNGDQKTIGLLRGSNKSVIGLRAHAEAAVYCKITGTFSCLMQGIHIIFALWFGVVTWH
jgi:hypothetical protein